MKKELVMNRQFNGAVALIYLVLIMLDKLYDQFQTQQEVT